MKNIIYKIGVLLLFLGVVISCESPEAETNYTEATSTYEYPGSITLASSNITTISFKFTYTNSGGGKGYYVIVEGGSTAPTNANVFSGTAAKLIKKGNFALTGAPVTITADGLCNNKTYDIYAVHMSSDNFLSPSPIKASVTTASKTVAGTYLGKPFAFGEYADEYTATLTPVAGTTNQYLIDSAWGPHFIYWLTGNPAYDNNFLYAGVLTINPDKTITIVGSNTWSAIGGTGTYDDSCIKTFTYTLKQTLFGNPFTTNVVLTQIQ